MSKTGKNLQRINVLMTRTKEDIEATLQKLKQSLKILETSAYYHNRGSNQIRLYLKVKS